MPEKPFVVTKLSDRENTCVGCSQEKRTVMIIPTGARYTGEEWFICNKCLQWLKSKLMGF
jgi:hypothetical protein